MNPMAGPYLGMLVLLGVAAFLCTAMVTLSWVLGPKKQTPYKASPYECGVQPIGDARERFPVKFYLVAIVFILFDIEAVFLWPLYTVFKNSETDFMVFAFFEFITYMATWIIGFVYAIRVGAIDWDETTSLAPEKLEATPVPLVAPAPREVTA
ncbi:NADH-quinone oxidoreductase subunit A [soil metagenome]